MGVENQRRRWQEQTNRPKKDHTNLIQNQSGYSPATLPTVVPRRPPALVRLPLWLAVLTAVVPLLLAALGLLKIWHYVTDETIAQPNDTHALFEPELAIVADALTAVRLSMPVESTAIAPTLAPNWPSPIMRWQDEIIAASEPYQFAPDLIAAIVKIESDGRPTGESYAGAVGLMGVMPRGSGAGLGDRPNATQLAIPTINLQWGTQILANYLHQADGDLALALAVYNGGWGYAGTATTQTYALNVLHSTGRALASRAGVEESAAIWNVAWEVCPCTGETITLKGVEIAPTVLFDDGEMRIEGVPKAAVE